MPTGGRKLLVCGMVLIPTWPVWHAQAQRPANFDKIETRATQVADVMDLGTLPDLRKGRVQ